MKLTKALIKTIGLLSLLFPYQTLQAKNSDYLVNHNKQTIELRFDARFINMQKHRAHLPVVHSSNAPSLV